MSFSMGYREVIPDQTATEKWTEFTLNTGGTQSTLQDIKVAERTGGYCYIDQTKYFTRNRFIYWRISHDVLELVEHSLDVNLTGNRVRYKFVDTPVLEGITIHEALNSIIVLIATVSSVHRFSFPHPDVIHNQDHIYPRLGSEYSAQSIFAEATVNEAKNPATFHVINHTYASTSLPHTSSTGLSPGKNDCLFALAYNTGLVLLIRMDYMTGSSSTVELKPQSDTMIPRFLSRALRGKTTDEETSAGMLFHVMDNETFLLSLCRDGNVRLWCINKRQCHIVTDLVPQGVQGAQSHMLRKAVSPTGHLYVAVLLCYSSHSVIHVLQSCVDSAGIRFQNLSTLYTPQDQDVIDLALTPARDVWAVFRSVQGETTLSVYRAANGAGGWHPCILENPLDREQIPLDAYMDVKQNYVEFIFHPGRFPASVINKALSIYRKSNIVTDAGVPTHVLKERVCLAVDCDIAAELQERDYDEQEQLELVNTCWQKFYSCCVEYHESGTRPIGLLLLMHYIPPTSMDGSLRQSCHDDDDMDHDGNDSDSSDSNSIDHSNGELVTSGLVMIKKNYISLVRPMDSLETVALTSVSGDYVKTISQLWGNGDSRDVVLLVKVLTYLDDNLPDEFKIIFDKHLQQLKTPLQTVSELFANEFSFNSEDTITNADLLYNVAVNAEEVSDMSATVSSLLDVLSVEQPQLADCVRADGTKWLIHLGHLYGSQMGISFVSNSLYQMILVRYELCRCLLIFVHLLQTAALQQFIKGKRFSVSADLVDRSSTLTQCYFVLLWTSQTAALPLQSLDSFETCVSALKLNEVNTSQWVLQPNYQHRAGNVTLLQHFLQSSASATVRLLLSNREIPQPFVCLWHQSLLPYVHTLMQLIWPICNNTMLSEFLMWSGQYVHLQEYTRLLSKWCHSNSYARKFLQACAFLDCGEHNKAFDTFNKAMHGVNIDAFIKDKVLRIKDNLPKDKLIVLYYLKVIKLFEQHNLYDLIIDLAKYGIDAAPKDDPELPTLYSIVFLNHLKVWQFEAAYESLLANPDSDRRRDCLRQLVVTLFEARQLDTLTKFSMTGMQDDLERIIEGRARSLDALDNEYYNFLYSFHVRRNSHRKAACVMYEQALRLSADTSSLSAEYLEAICRRYTAAINSLCLVNKEDAWIVKPLTSTPDSKQRGKYLKDLKTQVQVVILSDLKKELALCRARLRLMRFSPAHSAHSMSGSLNAHQVSAVLSNACLFTEAVSLCSLFGISPGNVLSTLATTCVRLDETESDSAWDWLSENDVTDLGSGSASNLAWRLLETLLMKLEEPHMSSVHKVVTAKLLLMGVFLPHWLVASYKMRNPGELLRLLFSNGRLEEAASLCIELIEATLGYGKERFNIETSLLPMNPATWLPFSCIDLIALELGVHSQGDPLYRQLHADLSLTLDKYLKRAQTVSHDKIQQKCFM